MAIFKKKNSVLTKLKRDESGTMALSWAVSLAVMLGVIGAAVDFSLLSSAKAKSQTIADTTALSAAIYVKTHGRPPSADDNSSTHDGLTEGDHTATSLGYGFKNFVIDGSDGVNVNIHYDDAAKEVTTTVTGETLPFLVQLLGVTDLPFQAQTVVSYLEIEEAFPASIALVLDNSGSMAWDDRFALSSGLSPAGARPRITGLEEAVDEFMSDLDSRLGPQNNAATYSVLRTGMLPYNDAIIPAATTTNPRGGQVAMDWGRIEMGDITAMEAEGATNSSPPMTEAWTWLQNEVGVDSAHYAEAQAHGKTPRDPLRFVIFMTDGQNTTGNLLFIEDDSTNRFYAFKSLFGRSPRWWVSRNRPFDSDFKEGRLQLASDQETLDACTEMHNETNPVKIFSIGYALQPGLYNANNPSDDTDVQEVTVGMQATAHALLTGCATDQETMFIEADDIDQLKAAFDEIQNAIVEELIRIKS